MNASRFDKFARILASRRTRRATLAGSAGLLSASLGGRVLAHDSAPASTPVNDPRPDADTTDVSLLFVQTFQGGTWTPKANEANAYTVTLTGMLAQTIYFSDRPERIFGHMPTEVFLEKLGFEPGNEPNAALVAETGTEGQHVIVIEFLNPAYDDAASSLTYDAVVLADYSDHALAHAARRQTDDTYPESFGAGGLFIDSLDAAFICHDGKATCYSLYDEEDTGSIDVPRSYNLSEYTCEYTYGEDGRNVFYQQLCSQIYPDECPEPPEGAGYPCIATGFRCDGSCVG